MNLGYDSVMALYERIQRRRREGRFADDKTRPPRPQVPVHYQRDVMLIRDSSGRVVAEAGGPVLETPGCPLCGSPLRSECWYVPGGTGQPVSCPSDWHDDDARGPGDDPAEADSEGGR